MTFEEISAKYPRMEELTEDQFRVFVGECFQAYEDGGFENTFSTPWSDLDYLSGMGFTIDCRVPEYKDDPENGSDLECMPAWYATFVNGEKHIVFPEEVCKIERSEKTDACVQVLLRRQSAAV